MTLMAACAVLLLLGLVAAARWGGRAFVPPPPATALAPAEVARRFTWYAALALTGGIAAGLTVIGGGGRLAMRLLAVTGGDRAQGRITEADEVVGRITTDGTIGFVLFNGIVGGVAGAGLYLALRRYLPAGWLTGVAFGAGLLIVFGTTVEPLRRDNPDFDIVGPGWLAVLVFGAMAFAFGLALAGILAALSTWLPLPSTERAVLVRYLLPALAAALAFSLTALLIVVLALVVLVTRWSPVLAAVRSPRWLLAGRVLLAGLVLVSLPGATASIVDIVGR